MAKGKKATGNVRVRNTTSKEQFLLLEDGKTRLHFIADGEREDVPSETELPRWAQLVTKEG